MKKNKTALGISSLSLSVCEPDDGDLRALERQSRALDDNVYAKKNQLLKKEVEMLKNQKSNL